MQNSQDQYSLDYEVPKELSTSEQTIFFKNPLGPYNGVIYTPVTCVYSTRPFVIRYIHYTSSLPN